MDTLYISGSQIKTLQAIRETLSVFSDWEEDATMVIKRGKPTTLMVAFKTDKGVFQYQINKTGAIIQMSKVTKLSGLCLESFDLSIACG
jgi:hypothetical protein